MKYMEEFLQLILVCEWYEKCNELLLCHIILFLYQGVKLLHNDFCSQKIPKIMRNNFR